MRLDSGSPRPVPVSPVPSCSDQKSGDGHLIHGTISYSERPQVN
jgi:hypothetical protein